MSSRKRRRLSAWGILAHLGHTGDDQDAIVQHVFDTVSRVTLRGDDGKPMDGGDYLVSVFKSLGTTKDWPGCGTPEWERLRYQALMQVVRRLGREGLLDCVSVGSGTPAPSDTETGKPTEGEQHGGVSDGTDARDTYVDCETNSNPRVAKDDASVAGAVDVNEATTTTDGEHDGKTPAAKDENPDPRVGVQAYRAMIRRARRNPTGWFRLVNRDTPYRVLVQWAKDICPGASAESLAALMDRLRKVRWWDDDGHVLGGEILQVMEAELEAGCDHKQWMLVVSDFEDAIRRLRSVFEKLCLL